MEKTAAEISQGLKTFMRLDHHRLAGIYRRVVETFGTGDFQTMRADWAHFERAVEAHMAAEERYALPLFRVTQAEEAAALVEDHRRLRRRLAELGVGVDLHLLSAKGAEAFITELESHAAREERLFYAWADRELATEASGRMQQEILAARPQPGG